jgi:hypothetical protein
MKFIVELNSTKILMDADQIEILTNLLHGTEQITNKYIGSTSTTKSNYLKIIDLFSVQDTLKVGAMPDEEYDAMVLITKLHNESNA